MSYSQFRDLIMLTPGPITPKVKLIMHHFLNQKTSAYLIDRRDNLQYFVLTKFERAEMSVLTDILLERDELRVKISQN